MPPHAEHWPLPNLPLPRHKSHTFFVVGSGPGFYCRTACRRGRLVLALCHGSTVAHEGGVNHLDKKIG